MIFDVKDWGTNVIELLWHALIIQKMNDAASIWYMHLTVCCQYLFRVNVASLKITFGS